MTTAKTETKTTNAKTTAKKASAIPTMPDFEAFAMPNMEMPAAYRDFAEKGVEQFRDAYERVRSVAQESSDMLEDSYETTRQGLVEMNLKAIEAAQSNTDAAYDFIRAMTGVKSVSQAIELQTSYARQQFDSLTSQSKEMQEMASKMATEAGAPVKDAVEKIFKDVKAA